MRKSEYPETSSPGSRTGSADFVKAFRADSIILPSILARNTPDTDSDAETYLGSRDPEIDARWVKLSILSHIADSGIPRTRHTDALQQEVRRLRHILESDELARARQSKVNWDHVA